MPAKHFINCNCQFFYPSKGTDIDTQISKDKYKRESFARQKNAE
jgi:hypothetical protein